MNVQLECDIEECVTKLRGTGNKLMFDIFLEQPKYQNNQYDFKTAFLYVTGKRGLGFCTVCGTWDYLDEGKCCEYCY